MFWQEKIDYLKKRFGPKAFRDPFRHGIGIRERIFARFFEVDFLENEESWELKEALFIRSVGSPDFWQREWKVLATDERYWLLIAHPPNGGSFQVYDGNTDALQAVIQMGSTGGDFFLVEKKYNRLIHLKKSGMEISLWKSGSGKTPFG
jgi:hypothetical protein